ncbi:tyrosine-type recombinase/integrase [Pseudonocardia sp. D17]|uniref:tyrosine-type recombinase/integrase n=1 Tax=Pseudonocardia sp. D17 TaxID=882661 RepID=UPI002B36B3A8|nr:site-specific integrase [Pseudonocardia sp. D17]
MTTRRSRGEGGLHWDERRQRWIATASLGFDARGKRITKKASGATKTAAKKKLRDMLRDHEDGLTSLAPRYTVAEAVRYWLDYGLSGRAAATVENYRGIAESRIVPQLGRRRLAELSAEDVDRWLRDQSAEVSTRTLRLMHSILNRAVTYAMARDKVRRNVVALSEVPTGTGGRPSKSLTFDEAERLLKAAEETNMRAYIVLSLLIGARTEELRALRWEDVDLAGKPDATPPVPPSISVIRSVRVGGDTKTRRSRRRLAMPLRCVDALRRHRIGRTITPSALVFATSKGTELDSHNVRRSFRRVVASSGLDPAAWTPRELRHSFVSLLSESGVPLEQISRLVGHNGTAVTESVYRKQLRPVLDEGATAMDTLFPLTGP